MDVVQKTHNMTKKQQKFNVPDFLAFESIDNSFDLFEKP